MLLHVPLRVPIKLLHSSSGFSLLSLACYVILVAGAVPTNTTATSSSSHQVDGIKCKNEQGKDVDWFIVYKLPRIRSSSNPLIRAGLAYVYIVSTSSPGVFSAEPEINRSSEKGGDIISASEKYASGHKGSLFGGHQRHHHHHIRRSDHKSYGGAGLGTYTGSRSPAATATWSLSKNGIDSPGSMVGQTLGKLYVKDSQDVAYFTYNDQPPVGPTLFSGGHSKGIIITSLASGFWLQHSIPHFPLIDYNNYYYQYPATGKTNGQILHCISLPSASDIDNLGKIFDITKPHTANYSFPTESLQRALPQLLAIAHRRNFRQDNDENISSSNLEQSHGYGNVFINQTHPNTATADNNNLSPCLNEVDEKACLTEINNSDKAVAKKSWDLMEIRSVNGRVLRAYAKGPSFHEDIYSAWIAPAYKTKLVVQSWLNGPNPYPSNCTIADYSVFNILNKRLVGEAFSTHNDHSKWAASTTQSLVCISDLNRMEHQQMRGGVTLCFVDSPTWMAFNSSIIEIQPCPRLTDGDTQKGEVAGATTSTASTQVENGGVETISNADRERSLALISSSSRSANTTYDEDTVVGKRRTSERSHADYQLYQVRNHHLRRQQQRRKVKSRTLSFRSV